MTDEELGITLREAYYCETNSNRTRVAAETIWTPVGALARKLVLADLLPEAEGMFFAMRIEPSDESRCVGRTANGAIAVDLRNEDVDGLIPMTRDARAWQEKRKAEKVRQEMDVKALQEREVQHEREKAEKQKAKSREKLVEAVAREIAGCDWGTVGQTSRDAWRKRAERVMAWLEKQDDILFGRD